MGYYHPSIDHLLSSIMLLNDLEFVSIYVLSGIGDDGTRGSLNIKNYLPKLRLRLKMKKAQKFTVCQEVSRKQEFVIKFALLKR